MRSSSNMLREYERKMSSWFRSKRPDVQTIELSGMRPASSGNSNATFLFTWSFVANGEKHSEDLVLRWCPPETSIFPDQDLSREVGVLRALAGTAVAVPNVLWLEEDASIFGAPFVVMQYIAGKVTSDYPPGFHGHGLFYEASHEQRAHMWWAVLEQIALLHLIDWRRLELLSSLGRPATLSQAIQREVNKFEEWLRFAQVTSVPVLYEAIDWLRTASIAESSVSLQWGDARPGNAIFRESRVVGLVDWEGAWLGPAECDLAYFIVTSDVVAEMHGVPPLEGIPTAAATVARYERITGRPVANYHHAEILACLRIGVTMALTLRASPPHLNLTSDLIANNPAIRKLTALLK